MRRVRGGLQPADRVGRSRPVVLLAALLGFTALALLIAIAVRAVTGRADGPPDPLALEGVDRTAAFRAETRAIYEGFAGSQADRQALEVLRTVETPAWADWRRCLADQGAPLPPASRHVKYAPPTVVFRYGGPLWEPRASVMSDWELAWWYSWAMSPPPFKDPFVKASDVRECASLRPAEPFESPPTSPGGKRLLRAEWDRALEEAIAPLNPDFDDDYQTCLREELPVRKAVAPGPDGDEITDPAYVWFHRYYNWGDLAPGFSEVPIFGHTPGESWNALLRRESAFLAADWDCRGQVYDAAVALAEPVIARFASDHRDQIAEWRDYWRGVQREARRHGWHPDLSYDELTGGHLR